jgi:hypothetical protein
MSLNHSEQFYWLDPLGVGASRVRKVRHKYNSQVPNFHLEKSFSNGIRNLPVKKSLLMEMSSLMSVALMQSLVPTIQTSHRSSIDGMKLGRHKKFSYKRNSVSETLTNTSLRTVMLAHRSIIGICGTLSWILPMD